MIEEELDWSDGCARDRHQGENNRAVVCDQRYSVFVLHSRTA
jgi:hypothetical protein